MTLSEFSKHFGLSKILKCKQASIDTFEDIEETISLWIDGEIDFETAVHSINYDVDNMLEVIDKDLYDWTFWNEVKSELSNIKNEK